MYKENKNQQGIEKLCFQKSKLRCGFARIFLFFVLTFMMSCVPASTVKVTGTLTAEAATSKTTVAKKANAIIKKTVKSSDSKLTQLKKLFKYAEKTWGYSRTYNFDSSVSGWTRTYAYSIMKNKKGSCYHFAAGFAYLARQALGSSSKYTVRVAVGQTKGFGYGLQSHAWVEIKINGTWYIFDPNMDKFAEDSSLTYYKKKRSSSAMKKVYNSYKNTKYFTVSYVKTS
ncbi:MAG: hypothetical protein LUI07_10395 [Lachnospiraceae bacterium]|nr:hypothetical protein [Lachnospiraceae bacterium]